MAKVKIQGHASGTGILTVTAPNTSTDRTITLPDGTGTLIADDGSGNLGINTTTPSTNLEIKADDNLTTTFPVKVINSAGTGSTQFGAYAIDTTSVDLTLKAGGNTALTIDKDNGNVGIGTSTPLAPVVASTTVTADSDKIVYGMTQSDNNAGRIVGMGIASTGSVANQGLSFYTCLSSVQSERMRIDSYGNITKPAQPAFSVTKTSDQSITPANDRQITWETEEFDVGSNFASNIFTAPITGKYFLHAMVRIDDVDTAASYYRTGIQSSNKTKYEIIRPLFTSDVAYISMSVASIFDMDAGDTAEVTVRQQGGTDQVHIDDTIWYTNFCGYLLG